MIGWFVIAVCWLVSFISGGIEAGLLSLDQVRLRHQVKVRNRSAILLDELVKQPERLLATILLVTNLADISGLLLLTKKMVYWLGTWGYPIALLVAAPIYLFVLGVLPKSLFRRFPYRALAAFAGPLVFISRLLWPLLECGSLFGRLLFRQNNAPPRLFAAREDLKQITVESERQGALTSAERVMIHNVVDFRTVKVSDVMVARAQVVAVNPETTVPELLALSARTGIDRIPVLGPEDRATGLVTAFDLLLDAGHPRDLGGYIGSIVSSAEGESAYRIIRRLRAADATLSVVVDERDRLTGIVTLEDLVKRLIQSN